MIQMNHPKMRYTYVGIDSHKDTHTAVFLDCFFEKLGEIAFANLPSEFPEFLAGAEFLKTDGTELMFGLEDVSMYGRTLAVFLKQKSQKVKHVNALLVARERKNQSITQKTDAVDAECAARVLLSKFSELPDGEPDDRYWILKTLIMRRDFITKINTSLKNHLHSLLTQHYPNYRSWFPNLDSMASLAFFNRYPSPVTLVGTTLAELTEFISAAALRRVGIGKKAADRAKEILETLQDTAVPFQEIRDGAVRSTIRQINSNADEIKSLDKTVAEFMGQFGCTLTTMTGIDVICAAQLLSCIGNIRKFPTPAKLARYSGIAPVSYSSGKTEQRFADKRSNRELNSIIYLLAVRIVAAPSNRVVNPFFYEYYRRKTAEGKTKKQALKCVQRRLVNIIWSMLTRNEPYTIPPFEDETVKQNVT